MYEIKYEIKLNESGRPCIDLPPDYEEKPEDKFFAMEITRYLLQKTFDNRSSKFDPETAKNINIGITVIQQVSDEIARILWQNMKIMGDTSLLFDKKYHIQVKTIEERDNLKHNGILYNDKIYIRQEGLKVFVSDEMKVYELKDGINNENWKEI